MQKMKPILRLLLCGCLLLVAKVNNAKAKANNVPQGHFKTIFEMPQDIPGLEVKTTNDKNGGSVIVRGSASLIRQKPPLFAMDGVVYGGDFTNINPQAVDRITVLKDAASTSVYCAQGALGVILIITKKGITSLNNAVVTNYSESAYAYFIERKTTLKVIGLDDEIIVTGIIQKQQNSSLVFIKKPREILVKVSRIKKVEMVIE